MEHHPMILILLKSEYGMITDGLLELVDTNGDDVMGWQTIDDINNVIKKIEDLTIFNIRNLEVWILSYFSRVIIDKSNN